MEHHRDRRVGEAMTLSRMLDTLPGVDKERAAARARNLFDSLPHGGQPGVTFLDTVIDYLRTTEVDEWQTDVVRSKDGTRNCFFGHLFAIGRDDAQSNALWEFFEETYATTYMVYAVNDGTHPDYQQEHARDRVIAYLSAIRDGSELTTQQSMDEHERQYLAEVSP